jgi:hypothetical protein
MIAHLCHGIAKSGVYHVLSGVFQNTFRRRLRPTTCPGPNHAFIGSGKRAQETLECRVESIGFRSNDDGKSLKAVPLEDEAAFRVFQERDLEHTKLLLP